MAGHQGNHVLDGAGLRGAGTSAVLTMNWQVSLCLLGLAAIVLCIGGPAFAEWHKRRFLRIPYETLNAHRITPRFIVGSDCK